MANELDLDKGISSLTGKKLRDRDKFLLDGLQDGAAAPFDLDVNNLAVRGTLTVDGASTFNGTVNIVGTFDFAEKMLIFSAL